MKRGWALAPLLCAASTAWGGEAEQNAAILATARSVALSYARNLPNFLCTQSVRRLGDWSATGNWVALDRVTVAVTFHNQKETYQVVGRNNRPSKQKLNSLSGAFSQGEFGSVLRLIFDPESRADFTWQKWDRSGLHPLAIFDYRVKAENSSYKLTAGTASETVGFHGDVAIEPESGRTLRWTVVAEPSEGFPILDSITKLEYGFRRVSGTEYLLPVRAEVVATERPLGTGPPMRYRNVIEFRDYRKFSADARIVF